ncbi:hypothetical protein KUV51_18825 [Tateyamaria omphalii]|uniref:hypothetical protein n=1 Tax=Tateyamaria omphalii TaxID=299262 RepID=UPI001C99D0D8|nr:hypothetical protein [Tateyamaria omphalii]MBY5935066.1 hypothetical protein [Tateyamaria omphalii]
MQETKARDELKKDLVGKFDEADVRELTLEEMLLVSGGRGMSASVSVGGGGGWAV